MDLWAISFHAVVVFGLGKDFATFNKEYRIRAIITRGLYIFIPILKSISLFSRRFFGKIVSLCMVSIKERVMMAHLRYIFLIYIQFQVKTSPDNPDHCVSCMSP